MFENIFTDSSSDVPERDCRTVTWQHFVSDTRMIGEDGQSWSGRYKCGSSRENSPRLRTPHNQMHRSQRQPMELKMNPAVIGFTTGAIHHVMIQYPNQAGLCTTMYAYAFANALFGAFLLSQMDVVSLGQILENFITFTTTYVHSRASMNANDCSNLPRSYWRRCIMYTSGIVESPANSGLSPPTGHSGTIHKQESPMKLSQNYIRTLATFPVRLLIYFRRRCPYTTESYRIQQYQCARRHLRS